MPDHQFRIDILASLTPSDDRQPRPGLLVDPEFLGRSLLVRALLPHRVVRDVPIIVREGVRRPSHQVPGPQAIVDRGRGKQLSSCDVHRGLPLHGGMAAATALADRNPHSSF
jgi:hypothetical protein